MRVNLHLYWLLAVLLFVAGCSEDDSDVPKPGEGNIASMGELAVGVVPMGEQEVGPGFLVNMYPTEVALVERKPDVWAITNADGYAVFPSPRIGKNWIECVAQGNPTTCDTLEYTIRNNRLDTVILQMEICNGN